MNRVHLVAAAAYAGMAAAALAVAVLERRGSRRALRTARHLFVAYVAGVSLVAGVSQRDLWPISSWTLMTGVPTRQMGVDPVYLRMLVVDDAGREYPVDYRAVEPLAIEELSAWMRTTFLELGPAARDSVGRFLLHRMNVARDRVRRGQPPGRQERWLGPLRAPYHTLHPKLWTGPASVPGTPFTTLRIYRESWDLEARARDPAQVRRSLLYQFHEVDR